MSKRRKEKEDKEKGLRRERVVGVKKGKGSRKEGKHKWGRRAIIYT